MINSLHERKRRRYFNIILLPKLWVEPEQKLWHPFYEIQWWYVIMKLIPKLVAFYCTVLNNKHWPGHYEQVFKLCEIKVFTFSNERCIQLNAMYKYLIFLPIVTCKAYDGPDTEEADDTNNNACGRFPHGLKKISLKYLNLFWTRYKVGFVIKGFSVILSKLNVVELKLPKNCIQLPLQQRLINDLTLLVMVSKCIHFNPPYYKWSHRKK